MDAIHNQTPKHKTTFYGLKPIKERPRYNAPKKVAKVPSAYQIDFSMILAESIK